jgi:hypothetical protein
MPVMDAAALEALYNDEAASESARRAENANLNRMDSLRRQEAAALDRLRSRDVINAAPRQQPPPTSARPGSAAVGRALNAARQIPIPSSAAALGSLGMRGLNAAGLFQLGGYGQGLSDSASSWLGDQLPEGLQPIYDGLDNLRRQGLGTLNPAEALGRAARDPNSLRPPGLGTLGLPGDPFSAPLTCNLFGIGCPERSPEGIPHSGSQPAAPPFYGGQTPGVQYNVTIQYQWIAYYTVTGQDRDFSGAKAGTFTGRITAISGIKTGQSGSYIEVKHANGTATYTYAISADDSRNQNLRFSITGVQISRADGQPDTGGNPDPLPGAPSRPGIVPPTAPVPAPATYPSGQPGSPTAPGALSPALAPNPATQPLAPTPTPPVSPAPTPPANRPREDEPNNPLIPLGLGLGLGLLLPGLLRGGLNARGSGTPPATSTTTTINAVCRFQEDTTSWGKLDTQYALLQTIQADQLRLLNQIDGKLGPQIPGGVSGKLGSLGRMASRTWNFLQVDRILNILSWIGILHNAYMLSNNLAQSLFSAIGSTLDAFGIQKIDEDGNEEAYDIGEMVGKWTDNWAKGVFGVQTWEGIKDTLKKVNRIYQAASNLLNSLQSISYAMLEGLETIGNYTAKIGNAARIFGVFTEKAFNPMRDNLNFKGGRFFRFLDNTQEFVENIDSISSNVVDIQQTAADCHEQKEKLQESISAFETAKKTEEETNKANSQGVTINQTDERKPES